MALSRDSKASAIPVLAYRRKGLSVGTAKIPGESATISTFVILVLLCGVASLGFLIDILSDWSTDRPINRNNVLALAACAFMAIGFALLGKWQLRKLYAQNPRDLLHCSRCGYDLRGGHERCPECGQDVPIKTETVAQRLGEIID